MSVDTCGFSQKTYWHLYSITTTNHSSIPFWVKQKLFTATLHSKVKTTANFLQSAWFPVCTFCFYHWCQHSYLRRLLCDSFCLPLPVVLLVSTFSMFSFTHCSHVTASCKLLNWPEGNAGHSCLLDHRNLYWYWNQ